MDAVAAHPSTSLALVPVSTGRAFVEGVTLTPPRSGSSRVHRAFYAMGYTGLVLFVCGAWATAYHEGTTIMFFVMGAGCVGLGGLGVLVHLLWPPRTMHKLRTTLGAIASLVLTAASVEAIGDAAREVRAASLVPVLQPLADDLVRYGRITSMAPRGYQTVELNGYSGRAASIDGIETARPGEPLTFEDVLRRDGVTREEFDAFEQRLWRTGMREVHLQPGYVLFNSPGSPPWRLLHVLPGHPLPARGAVLDGWVRWTAQPLGGGWYVVTSGE
jgi:hypothetical protein